MQNPTQDDPQTLTPLVTTALESFRVKLLTIGLRLGYDRRDACQNNGSERSCSSVPSRLRYRRQPTTATEKTRATSTGTNKATIATTIVGNTAAITNIVPTTNTMVCRPDGARVKRLAGETAECLRDRQRSMAVRAIATRDVTITT